MSDPTTAVVLAAGEGKRLRPLTRYQPKPMLPVANRPIIEYVIDALLDAGISDIVVVVGYQRRRLQDHLMQRYPERELTYIRQPNQLGSGDALSQVRDALSGSFLVVNGDNVIDERMVRGTIERYRESDVSATVAVGRSDRVSEYGTVCTENGRVTTILERHNKDDQGRINVGVYCFDDRIFDALDRTMMRSGELSLTDAISYLPGEVVSAVPDGVWFDPAYPWDMLRISDRLQSENQGLVVGSDMQFVDESARIHETAVVGDRTIVGPGCEVAAGAVLRSGSCLQADVRIGTNTVIDRTSVGADSRIGGYVILRDTVVGADVAIGDGTVCPGGNADFIVDCRVFRDRQLGSLVSDRAEVGANVTLPPGARVGPNKRVRHGTTVASTIEVEGQ
jgi:glucose-1-phosphate thymidylyltransferase